MRQYRVYDLSGTGAPDFYNGSELILAWRIVDNRNGNAVVSIFEMGHDYTSQQSRERSIKSGYVRKATIGKIQIRIVPVARQRGLFFSIPH